MWIRLLKHNVMAGNTEILINLDSIESFEANGDYTRVWIANECDTSYLVVNSCDEIFRMLDSNGLICEGDSDVQ